VGLEPTTSRLTAERICQIELPRIELPRIRDGGHLGLYASGIARRRRDHSSLYLGVAIGAQEDALARLRLRLCQRSSYASVTQREALIGRHKVVKLKRRNTATVAAYAASSACLIHEHLLYPTSASCDCLSTTFGTSISACTTAFERSHTVVRTAKQKLRLTFL
jgi:hypothetical protein